jgi:transposase-like protein
MKEESNTPILESWYEKTESKYICLRCHRAFKREYKSRSLSRKKKKVCGAKTILSLWAWNNFRRHLLGCWRKSELDK